MISLDIWDISLPYWFVSYISVSRSTSRSFVEKSPGWDDMFFFAMEDPAIFKNGSHHLFRLGPWLNHGYVTNNQRVVIVAG